jgi:hypothetical protein
MVRLEGLGKLKKEIIHLTGRGNNNNNINNNNNNSRMQEIT